MHTWKNIDAKNKQLTFLQQKTTAEGGYHANSTARCCRLNMILRCLEILGCERIWNNEKYTV